MKRGSSRRRAMTLLELVLASTMMTVVVTSAAMLLRGVHLAWAVQEADLRRIEAAHATLRHIVRQARQAQSVSAITESEDDTGSLSLLMPSGAVYVWARDDATDEIRFGTGAADQLLAEEISMLCFTGYLADGATMTSEPAKIQAVKCEIGVQLPREVGGQRSVTCWAWLRAW